jgi:AcrR family transcriptional regulator
MKNLTRDEILTAAEVLVEQTEMHKVTLGQVGGALGVSHAALYKHFKNKQDLWTSLALRWLDNALQDIFPFVPKKNDTPMTIVHDWLWQLTVSKMRAKSNDPRMFEVYTTYIDHNYEALSKHTTDLKNSLMQAANISDPAFAGSLLLSFVYFSSPAFSETWGPNTKSQFEQVWKLVVPGISHQLS